MRLRLSSLGLPSAAAAVFVATSSSPAHAYLDPGTGSMILQLLLGGAAGVAVAGRFYWHRLLGLFGIERGAERTEAAPDEAPAKPRAD